ncbi:MAG: hypothetical protein NC935_08580 [Candidatus Omnitrophica bacterium]|nr:hypothetical protein [Candidatus Omnitrophota bacterium]
MRNAITLVEILIGTFVFIIAASSLLTSLANIFYLIDTASDTTAIVSDLRSILEKIRSTSFADVTTCFRNNTIDGGLIDGSCILDRDFINGNLRYPVMIGGYSIENEHITVIYANNTTDPLEICVTADWQDKRGRLHNISIATFKTR